MISRTRDTTHGEVLRALAPGVFVTLESRLRHGGSLQARRLSSGVVQFYWRYSHEGKKSREPIGAYDPTAPPKQLKPTVKGYSVSAALEQCAALASRHANNTGIGGLQGAKAQERRAQEATKAAQVAKEERTLEKLLGVYIAHLKHQGRRSWADAEQIFRAHVLTAWPRLAATPAVEIGPDQVLDMLRRLIEQGKGRTANKLRAYLRAAYQCAIDVRTTASIPVAFKAFAVVFNPAAQTKRDPAFDRADKRPLSLDDLRAYWQAIRHLDGLPGASLRLHLLTGGQRVEQILRLRWDGVSDDAITILDAKGRPSQGPRTHTVPLVPIAAADLGALERAGEFVMSTTKGARPVSVTTLANWAHAAADGSIGDFQLKRIRSGVETLLAANGVSREIRGHLQSHGLTGVQARHYDAHDYLPEKRRALLLLLGELEKKRERVVPPASRIDRGLKQRASTGQVPRV